MDNFTIITGVSALSVKVSFQILSCNFFSSELVLAHAAFFTLAVFSTEPSSSPSVAHFSTLSNQKVKPKKVVKL